MRTKAFQAFETKLSFFEDDIELIDVIRNSVIKGDLTDQNSIHVLKDIDPNKHGHIARRKNSDKTREHLVNHLRATLYSSYVKDVYEELTFYLKTVLNKAAENGIDAGRIIGEHSFKINAKYVLEEGTWENVATLITDSLFRKLESERSTLKLLKKVATKLDLNIDDNLINTALPYLEVRHFLVHTDGKVSEKFKQSHPHIKLKGETVLLNYEFICKLRNSVKKLVTAYDNEIISANLLKNENTQP